MIRSQLIKFIAIGIVNTLFYYLIFSLFIFLGLDYKFAVLFATLIGVLFSFKTFGKFVFNNNNKKLIFKFLLVYTILYVLNIIFIFYFNTYFKNYYISGLVATIICAILSFVLNKFYVYKYID